MSETLVSLEKVSVKYYSFGKYSIAIRDVTMELKSGEILGVVGESGAGKSTVGWAILNLIEPPSRLSGKIIYSDGKNVNGFPEWKMAKYRWKKVSMVFQASMNGFDPLQTIGRSFTQLLIEKRVVKSKEEAYDKAADLLKQLNLPVNTLSRFPHELSGGMKQRISIAMAISCNPEVIIADEPTTALDVVSQFGVINILKNLVTRGEVKGLIFITHDIAVQLLMADRLMVMYGGRVVEEGNKSEIVSNPKHPYTKVLFNSILDLKMGAGDLPVEIDKDSQPVIENGCPFATRCPHVTSQCRENFPEATSLSGTHKVYCYLYG